MFYQSLEQGIHAVLVHGPSRLTEQQGGQLVKGYRFPAPPQPIRTIQCFVYSPPSFIPFCLLFLSDLIRMFFRTDPHLFMKNTSKLLLKCVARLCWFPWLCRAWTEPQTRTRAKPQRQGSGSGAVGRGLLEQPLPTSGRWRCCWRRYTPPWQAVPPARDLVVFLWGMSSKILKC